MIRSSAIAATLALVAGMTLLGATKTQIAGQQPPPMYLSVAGISGQSQAYLVKVALNNGKSSTVTYGLFFGSVGKPAPNGTYACANKQSIKVVGPTGTVDATSIAWAANSGSWTAVQP
jgi:hypothetical protein